MNTWLIDVRESFVDKPLPLKVSLQWQSDHLDRISAHGGHSQHAWHVERLLRDLADQPDLASQITECFNCRRQAASEYISRLA